VTDWDKVTTFASCKFISGSSQVTILLRF